MLTRITVTTATTTSTAMTTTSVLFMRGRHPSEVARAADQPVPAVAVRRPPLPAADVEGDEAQDRAAEVRPGLSRSFLIPGPAGDPLVFRDLGDAEVLRVGVDVAGDVGDVAAPVGAPAPGLIDVHPVRD